MSSGRLKFKKNKYIIDLIVKLLEKIPIKFVHTIWYLINGWQGVLGIGMRYCTLKAMCSECGDNVYIAPDVEIKNFEGLNIGSNVSIHRFCYIDAKGGIDIGSNVSIAHSSSIISFNHRWDNKTIPIKYNKIKLGKISIEDDVWIGCGARILSGVKVGKRSVVAAGSVVTSNVDELTVVGGVPSKEIKKI